MTTNSVYLHTLTNKEVYLKYTNMGVGLLTLKYGLELINTLIRGYLTRYAPKWLWTPFIKESAPNGHTTGQRAIGKRENKFVAHFYKPCQISNIVRANKSIRDWLESFKLDITLLRHDRRA